MRLLISVAGLSAALSVAVTTLAERAIPPAGIVLLGSWLRLVLTHNAGVAFGITVPAWVLWPAVMLALLLVLHLAWQWRERSLPSVGFGLIVGGALANLFDRLEDGLVTDYIAVGDFPVFNVADSCITVGVLLLLWRWGKEQQS